MNKLKKITLTTILSAIALCFIVLSKAHATSDQFFYEPTSTNTENTLEQQLDIAKTIQADSLGADNSILGKIRDLFGLQSYQNEPRPALAYAQMIINLVLSLTSFIALVVVIFAFYQIFFVKGEEGVAKAKKMLTGVVIALVIMGLSWIIVSFFFTLFSSQTNNVGLLDSHITHVV